ncbi:hypothetical protein [Mycobacterium marinum]|uniref:hypothetical protein n=1 Tax=Mycobacterium marinum TaxID=1781 RepID=UPI00192099FB|nr:hypothetical protein [Mycobacterium marinum]QQW33492.1 hypothetical protein HXW97_06370 [Mycobacterium marinum]GJO20750.1 hypothetical protein NJB1507_17240 [Mycobacterium marinum]
MSGVERRIDRCILKHHGGISERDAYQCFVAPVSVNTNGARYQSDVPEPIRVGGVVSAERDAARVLASAYRTADAISSAFDKTSSVFQSALDDGNRADRVMAGMCL